MKLLLTDIQLDERRKLAGGALAPLADSLAADLEPWLGKAPYFPKEKALFSKVGGYCETDKTELEFDPASPDKHRCPLCGRIHTGEYQDRYWVYLYQLWLAERAVHAAILFALRGDARHATFARDVLTGYADRYLKYPNRDCVIGPSHLFFSTYLESLWLLHVCIATDALEGTGDHATADDIRKRIVQPAVELIEVYDEGRGNRQVWNNAAIIAARLLLGEPLTSPGLTHAFASIEEIFTKAVGKDGSWYEGDNYHQFAHRGLSYTVALGERAGYPFKHESLDRFEAGFTAPFRAALPDFTYPARKDSRYAASYRQWRFAESCELGVARHGTPVLSWALSRMYATDIPPGDTGRSRSTGEAERNFPPVRLTRADLGWRSLLFANEKPPTDAPQPPGSLTIESQGLTIHRRDAGAAYVALDWGQSGGGHGHGDRLNVLFSNDTVRWLDDLGTGSYADESLHWYRSTLAHTAPLIDGVSQARVNGQCVGAGATPEFDFIAAYAGDLADKVLVWRTLVTGADYFIDEVRWSSDRTIRFELPVHFDAACGLTFTPKVLDGGTGLEDGFDQVTNGEVVPVAAGSPISLVATGAQATLWCDQPVELYRASGPGQPATRRRTFYVLRCQGTAGVIRSAWSWFDAPLSAKFSNDAVTVTAGGTEQTHKSGETTWLVSRAGSEVAQFRRTEPQSSAEPPTPPQPVPHDLLMYPPHKGWFSDLDPLQQRDFTVFQLGEANYRRSEETWIEARRPAARVALVVEAGTLVIDIFVETEHPIFVPAGAVNPYDNENADINGHGVQLYIAIDKLTGGWMLVPELGGGQVRVRQLNKWGKYAPPSATWRTVAHGFEMQIRLPIVTDPFSEFRLDLIVNDMAPGRERRRGQLVMNGAKGEFVYLRGEGHDLERLVWFRVT